MCLLQSIRFHYIYVEWWSITWQKKHNDPAYKSWLTHMTASDYNFQLLVLQSSPEMQVQGRWPHLPPPPLHSVALSPPLQHQQAEAFPSSQFSHGPTLVDPSITANKSTITQFADELGLVDRTSSKNVGPSVQAAVIVDTGGGADTVQNGNSSKNSNSNSSFKIQSSSQQKNSFSNYQRGGGVSQKNSSGGEWSHNRRMGFQGRNQPFGGEKSYPSSKMKQIYVAKQTSDGSSWANDEEDRCTSRGSVETSFGYFRKKLVSIEIWYSWNRIIYYR